MMHTGFGHYGNWLCGPGFFFSGPFGWIVTLLFWGLVVYLLVKLFQFLLSGRDRGAGNPLNTLKERYARGEISAAEYKRMRTELT